jgi:hypothetical protein
MKNNNNNNNNCSEKHTANDMSCLLFSKHNYKGNYVLKRKLAQTGFAVVIPNIISEC